MKNKFATMALVLASGLIAGTPALAERIDANTGFGNFSNQPIGSNATREQVAAELVRAHRADEHQIVRMNARDADGTLPKLQESRPAPSSVTREQVTAELARAHRTGEHKVIRRNGRDDDGTLLKL